MRLGINHRVYLSAELEIQLAEDGTIQTTLSWPIDHYHTQDHVDLSTVVSQAARHYKSLDGHARGLGSLSEKEIEDFANSQSEFATAFSESLFVGKLQRILDELVDSADGRTILLGIDLPKGPLELLPWEIIGNPQTTLLRKKNKHVSLTVYRKIATSDMRGKNDGGMQQARQEDKVKLMLVGSQPYRRSGLHTGTEFANIEGVLKNNPKVVLLPGQETDYNNVDYVLFNQLLFSRNPQILHLACHGTRENVDFSRGESEQFIPHGTLIGDIRSIDSIKLVVLNICYSASSISDAGKYVRSLASQLVDSGISAVVGMVTSITDLAAIEFSRWFYLALSQNKSVCEAYHSAVDKLRIFNQGDRNLWSVPMLFVKENVNPFMEILDQAKELSGSPFWPLEFIEDTINITNEFVIAFKRIHPQPQWNAFSWQMETRKVFRVYMQTIKQLTGLGTQFSSAKYLEHRITVLEILSLQRQIVEELDSFGRNAPDWGGLDFRNPRTANTVGAFMHDGEKLVEKMERLVTKLESVLRDRTQ